LGEATVSGRVRSATLAGRRASRPVSQGDTVAPRRACLDTAVAPTTSKERNTGFPILEILPNRSLPPVECIFGVKPIHAAKCRPELNALGSGARLTEANGTAERATALGMIKDNV
jgi:hypothetical protein